MSQDKKKPITDYAKERPRKSVVDEIVEWFVEEREKKKGGK